MTGSSRRGRTLSFSPDGRSPPAAPMTFNDFARTSGSPWSRFRKAKGKASGAPRIPSTSRTDALETGSPYRSPYRTRSAAAAGPKFRSERSIDFLRHDRPGIESGKPLQDSLQSLPGADLAQGPHGDRDDLRVLLVEEGHQFPRGRFASHPSQLVHGGRLRDGVAVSQHPLVVRPVSEPVEQGNTRGFIFPVFEKAGEDMFDGMPFRGAGGKGEGGEFVEGLPPVDELPEPFPVSFPVPIQYPVPSEGCRPAIDRRAENRQNDQEKERDEREQDPFKVGEHPAPLSFVHVEFRECRRGGVFLTKHETCPRARSH